MDKWNEESATTFIDITCQLIPKSSLVYSDHMHNLSDSNDPLPTEYAILCGSEAEFYIRPLITCIDDADFLGARTDELVFSGNVPVLSSDLSGLTVKIRCFKIEPYDRYPGFVRLRVYAEMNYNWICKRYEFNRLADTNDFAVLQLDKFTRWYDPVTVKRGNLLISIVDPAVKQRSGERIFRNLRVIVNDLFRINSGAAVKHRSHIHVHPNNSKEFDYLRSVWCPHWPEEAHGFLNRPRNNGWPTTDIICEVLQNGCHVVWIQHRSCRNDDLQ